MGCSGSKLDSQEPVALCRGYFDLLIEVDDCGGGGASSHHDLPPTPRNLPKPLLPQPLLCFSRLKRPSRSAPPPIPHSLNAPTTSASLSSFVVFKSFNSLYDPAASDFNTLIQTLSSSSSFSAATTTAAERSSFSSTTLSSTSGTAAAANRPCPSDRDLSTAISSHCFFLPTLGPSNSILDSAAMAVGIVRAGVTVPTYSPDPYWDFWWSMEEMVAALGLDLRVHAVHLHELLLCYLALNLQGTATSPFTAEGFQRHRGRC